MGRPARPQSVTGAGGLIGHYLAYVPSENTPPRAEIFALLRHVVGLAERCMHSLRTSMSPPETAPEQALAFLRERIHRSPLLGTFFSPWADVCKSVFFHELCLRVKKPGHPPITHADRHRVQFGARSQHFLTRALLKLSPEERRQVSLLGEDIRIAPEDWVATFRGAICVARISVALIEISLTPILPDPEIDAYNGIDLLVTEGRGDRGFRCIQSKSVLSQPSSKVVPMGLAETQEDTDDERRIKSGMRAFKETHQLDWIAGIMIYVGRDENRLWEFEKWRPLGEKLHALLAPSPRFAHTP